MAETTELDFAKMWRKKASSRLVLSCENGRGHVEPVADLEPPYDHHRSHHFQALEEVKKEGRNISRRKMKLSKSQL